MRSSKNQWFGGTTGFYWGNNNIKDLDVRMETIAATNDRPADMTFCPERPRQGVGSSVRAEQGEDRREFRQARVRQAAAGVAVFLRRQVSRLPSMALQLKSFAHWGDPYGQLVGTVAG